MKYKLSGKLQTKGTTKGKISVVVSCKTIKEARIRMEGMKKQFINWVYDFELQDYNGVFIKKLSK